jgi:O-succinylbenzoic acid--CoA ligase
MKFHKSLRINECSFETVDELLLFSKGLSDDVSKFLNFWFDTSEFIRVHTSGSTGVPKEILLRKEFMVNSAKATGAYFSLNEDTSALLCLSANYIAGKMMIVRALTLGWCLDIVETNATPLDTIDKEYDFSAMVPLQLENSISSLSKIKKLIVGGGVVSQALISKLQNVSTKVYATYGMTETITHIAIKKINFLVSGDDNKYKLLPNISISLDSRGCLVIDAPELSEELVVTNDIVTILDQNHFEWNGRYDSIINSGGVKLIPEQIEKKISEKLSQRFFISSLKDEKLGEKLILVVEGSSKNLINKEEIILFLKGVSLDKYELPKNIYFVEKFIETGINKIHRKKTLERLG